MRTGTVKVKSPEDFDRISKRKKLEILDNLTGVQQKYLRSVFDCSALDAHKQACIEIAELLEFDDLAEELQADLETDRFLSTI
jgi:hypothetical protein